jgi:hypothetical protein
MMQDNTPINFYIKHFFINCQIKKLQPIFDTFVPACIFSLYHRHEQSITDKFRLSGGVTREAPETGEGDKE